MHARMLSPRKDLKMSIQKMVRLSTRAKQKVMETVCAVLLGVLICASPLEAQTVSQSGSVTPGHPARFVTTGVIADGGSPTNGSLTGIGVTASGPAICQNSGPLTGALNRICIGATQTGGGVLSLDNINGGTGGFTFRINGVTQGIATVTLPVTEGNGACFADTTGTLQNCSPGPLPSIVACGADPTGVADSTTAINNCLSANTVVYAPPGTYKIAAPGIQFTAIGQSIIGANYEAVTLMYSGASGAVLNFNPDTGLSTISGMTIDRTGVPDSTGNGMAMVGDGQASYITLRDLIFQNQYNGLNLFPTTYSVVDNVQSLRNYNYGFYMYGTDAYPIIQWVMQSTIASFNDSIGYNVTAAPNASTTLAHWTGTASFANTGGGYSFNGTGGGLYGMNLTSASGGSEGSTVFLINTLGAGNFINGGFAELAGVSATGRTLSTPPSNTGYGIALGNNTSIQIANFQVDNNSEHGILVGANNSNVTISDTAVAKSGHAASNTYDGIHILSSGGSVTLSGIIAGRATETQRYGVYNAAAATTIITDSRVLNNLTAGCGGTEVMIGSNNFGTGCPVQSVPQGGTGLSVGTSGGIPYFSSTTTMASSGALTANLPVIGGGAGVAPTVGTRSGNTTAFVTTTGAQTSGNCVSIDASGNHIASGSSCNSGTVTSIATTAPITGGTITTTGTIACATCVTSAASLTANALMIGTAGTQASATTATGTGVLTALSVNTGTVGAFLVVPTLTANTVLGALTAVAPTNLSVPSCSTAASALLWTSGVGFGCNTSITANVATNVTATATSTNASFFPTFVASSSTGSQGIGMDADLAYNPSTNTFSAPNIGASIIVVNNNATNSINITGASTNSIGFQVANSETGGHTWGVYSSGGGPGPLGSFVFFDSTDGAPRIVIAPTTGVVSIPNGTSSTSKTTGAAVITGGLGVSGAIFTDTLSVITMASDTAQTDNTVCINSSGLTLKGSGTLGICLGTSGAQFKTAFAPMRAGLTELMQIPFHNYRYLPGHGDGGANMQYGTTAQAVERVLPDLVRQDATGTAINYDWGSLLFIGLHAIQQLKADNDNLRADIEQLKRRVNAR